MGVRPRGGAADGEQTRVSIVSAALAVFAAQGIDGVSVRAINRAAGVAPAAVHYHFGSKEALLDAVVDRHGSTVIRDVVTRIEALLRSDERPTPRQLIDALSRPYEDLLEREPVEGRAWLSVVAQLSLARDGRIDRSTAHVTALLQQLAMRIFPGADAELVRRAVRLAAITLIQMLVYSRDPIQGTDAEPPGEPRGDADLVVAFVVGGLTGAVESAS